MSVMSAVCCECVRRAVCFVGGFVVAWVAWWVGGSVGGVGEVGACTRESQLLAHACPWRGCIMSLAEIIEAELADAGLQFDPDGVVSERAAATPRKKRKREKGPIAAGSAVVEAAGDTDLDDATCAASSAAGAGVEAVHVGWRRAARFNA